MGFYLLVGALFLGVALVAARSFVRASPVRLAQGVRAFIAGFSALASTGLLFTGRFGLAVITIGATVMAIRAMIRSSSGGLGQFGAASGGQQSSEVNTDSLRMELDHASGELEGEVLRGPFAGRSLASLGLGELLDLLAECQREDPRAVALLETYLDRRQPDWRAHLSGDQSQGPPPAAGEAMDEATAWSILGLAPGASADDIKTAHRRLMIKLHPDHGGSSYLAAQLNQAKDFLLSRQR
jgi:DnaJ domain